ncbi:lipase family protein [Amycolatopsis anabasis]|uniref:lipase family protein n=1 Tax=Amycolatopsis anabasis TaxID=1840409 RepID=UPI00131D6B6C|nr:lipase family protein [Amycolatopsis anabasis]
MSIPVRRALAAALVSATTLAVLTVGSSPASADEAFYTPPSPLPAGRDGDVIKSQPSNVNNAKATRIMYLTRDAKNQPIPVTGTVLVPTKPWTGPGPQPIVAYAPFTAGMGDQCAVSKTLAGSGSPDLASGFQSGFINPLLEKGIAVAQTDYQGLGTPGEHTYVVRAAEAHAVLDVVRAAQRLPGSGLPANGPVGITGYSEGGGASASAVELAPEYAPELDVKGAYAGAAPADKAVLAKSLDGGYAVGFLGYALIGINAAYPETKILDLANEQGRQLFEEARKTCTMDAVFKYAFKQSSTLTKDGRPVSAYLNEPPFRAVVEDMKVGNRKPAAPVLVEHAPNDDIVPAPQGRQLAKDWCGKGANVQFKDIPSVIPVGSHVLGMMGAGGNSANWLADRFAGKPASGNCGQF